MRQCEVDLADLAGVSAIIDAIRYLVDSDVIAGTWRFLSLNGLVTITEIERLLEWKIAIGDT